MLRTVSDGPDVRKVISLKNKDDFLMHGVVLRNRVFRPAGAMFHANPFSPAPLTTPPRPLFYVKHFCVRRPSDFPRRFYDKRGRAGRAVETAFRSTVSACCATPRPYARLRSQIPER